MAAQHQMSCKASKADVVAVACNDWVEQENVIGAKSLKTIRKTSAVPHAA